LGNILPLWDDPLWLAEELAMIDMISHGRLVSGFVRGGGTESISHNASPTYNWERFQEAHDFIIKAWTTPWPWRWVGAVIVRPAFWALRRVRRLAHRVAVASSWAASSRTP
jgi:alkanesulfonate monooxygenase SsuD/methylene tetrahydromethanopterin reductase-like flavin-dependent oxidoreductase (luciferase family)